ncbi:MAG: N-acetyltransferase [Gammaproteobacteria bacterium]|nr:MAG: N-acetyltransferase [Gammaproteobacteria bacterium]
MPTSFIEPSRLSPYLSPVDFLQPVLDGPSIFVTPLVPAHFDELYQAASDPLIWAGHPSPLRYQKEEFCRWFELALESKGALVVVEKSSGKVIGSSRYYEYDESKSEICIGFTFLTRECWGRNINRELKSLMLEHAFSRVKTVWFHVGASNIRSQMAMKKIGATESHRAEKIINGKLLQYVFYKIEKAQDK